jgi:tetratricopeptide (TPR) repeat protein
MTWKAPALVVAILATAGGAYWWLGRGGNSAADLAEFRAQLHAEDPRTRLVAAERILQYEPMDGESRLVKGQALMDSERFSDARELLKPLTGETSPHRARALALYADTFIAEARGLVAVMSPTTAETNGPRVKALVAEADDFRRILAASGGAAAARAAVLVEARQVDVLAQCTKLTIKGLETEAATARAVNDLERAQLIRARTNELLREAQNLDDQLEQLCARALEADGNGVEPHVLLFHAWLRDGKYDRARQAGERIAGYDRLDRAVAGAIADALLSIEDRYGQPLTPGDLGLARRLIHHPGLVGPASTAFTLASATLALRDGAGVGAVAAEKLSRQVLADYDGHPRALCLLAAALVQQGRAEDAIRLLEPVNERLHQASLRCALGLAHLSLGDEKRPGHKRQGLELLRQASDIDVGYLPARLALAESLVLDGATLEAEPDIQAAANINPDHPRVRALRARLLVEKPDDGVLADMLTRGAPAAPPQPWEARDAILAAAMALDDTAGVRRLAVETDREQPESGLWLIAYGWLQTTPERRAAVADLVARVALDQLDQDPLRRALPPPAPSLSRSADAPRSGEEPAPSLEPLLATRFSPWPEELALQLVELALDRWPSQPELIVQAAQANLLLGRLSEARQWVRLLPADDALSARRALAIQAYCEGSDAPVIPPATMPGGGGRALLWEYLDLAQAVRRREPNRVNYLLDQYVRAHPWSEQGVLLVLRDAFARNDTAQADAAFERVHKINAALSLLARGRWDLARGKPMAALTDVALYQRVAPADRTRSTLVAEVTTRANLAQRRLDGAEAVFGDLIFHWALRRADPQIAWADVLLEADRPASAAKVLTQALADTPLTPRQLDEVLVRCTRLLSGRVLREALDRALTVHPNDLLLLLYQARAWENDGDAAAAEALVDRVLAVRPDAPRALMAKAHLAALLDRTPEAVGIYTALLTRGGRNAAAARAELDRLTPPAPVTPDPAAPPAGGPAHPQGGGPP